MTGESPPQGWSGGDPEDLAAWTLVRAYHLVGRRFYAALAPHGLSPQHFGILICLAEQPGISQAALARAVLATPQSVGELVHAMVDLGLVEREPPPARGHPARLTLSALGRARLDQVTPVVLEAVEPAVLGLSQQEGVRLNTLLHRVVSTLEPG